MPVVAASASETRTPTRPPGKLLESDSRIMTQLMIKEISSDLVIMRRSGRIRIGRDPGVASRIISHRLVVETRAYRKMSIRPKGRGDGACCLRLLRRFRTRRLDHVNLVVSSFGILPIFRRKYSRRLRKIILVKHESKMVVSVSAPIETRGWFFARKGFRFQFLSLAIAKYNVESRIKIVHGRTTTSVT